MTLCPKDATSSKKRDRRRNEVRVTEPNALACTTLYAVLKGVNAELTDAQITALHARFNTGAVTSIAATPAAPSIATVSATGLVTAVAVGTANITATFGGVTSSVDLITVTGNLVMTAWYCVATSGAMTSPVAPTEGASGQSAPDRRTHSRAPRALIGEP
jgi:hypothetical protein